MYTSVSKKAIITISKIIIFAAVLIAILSWYDASNKKELKETKKQIIQIRDTLIERDKIIHQYKQRYEKLMLGLRDDVVYVPKKPERDSYIRERLVIERDRSKQPLHPTDEGSIKTRSPKDSQYNYYRTGGTN